MVLLSSLGSWGTRSIGWLIEGPPRAGKKTVRFGIPQNLSNSFRRKCIESNVKRKILFAFMTKFGLASNFQY
jgi:hypothetical protein